MIRVCFALDAPYLGGAERYVGHIVRGLDPRRFQVSLVMRAGTSDRALAEWARGLSTSGVHVETVPMRLPFRPLDGGAVYRAFRAVHPHVVHINLPGPYDGQMGLLAPIARLAGARVAVTEHLPMVERLWKRALVKRAAYHCVERVVTVSHANVRFLVERQRVPPAKIRVVHNALPRAYGTGQPPTEAVRAHHGLPGAMVVVLFVGNIVIHKGLHRVIEALSRIPHLPWHLVVVGTGPEELRSQDLARARGVEGRVAFLGARTNDEVEAIITACDALVLPSLVEGLPYVVLEAMACRLPVVSTRVSGIPEAVADGETGLLIDPGDDGALTQALARLVADGDLRSRMGKAGRARFERMFTLDKQIDAMTQIYDELAGGGAP